MLKILRLNLNRFSTSRIHLQLSAEEQLKADIKEIQKNKNRPRYSDEIGYHLEKYFHEEQFLTRERLNELHAITGLEKYKISRWFTSKRYKSKSETKKRDPLHLELIKNYMKTKGPYPSREEMDLIAAQSGKTFKQIQNGFQNQRKRQDLTGTSNKSENYSASGFQRSRLGK